MGCAKADPVADATLVASVLAGGIVYEQTCAVCHVAGQPGAAVNPKALVKTKDAWIATIQRMINDQAGADVILNAVTVEGKASLADYLVNNAGAE